MYREQRNMFERFTERARQVVVLAQEEARKLHSEYIGSSHILLGLMREEDGLASKALKEIRELTQDDVRDFIGIGDCHEPIGGQIPFTGSAQKTLERALREALSLGHSYIGTEHILLGLTEAAGELDEFLNRKVGPNWEEIIRLEVMELLKPAPEPAPTPEAVDVVDDDRDLEEIVIDLLTGFKMWKEHKEEKHILEDDDEALIRWIKASKASEYL